MFLTYVQRQPFCLCFPEMDDTFKPLYSYDELAVRNMYLGFFSMLIYLFCICVLGLAYFHIDDSCDSLDRNHLPLENAGFIPSHEGHQDPSHQEDPLQKKKNLE